MLTRIKTRDDRDAGFTLIELLVVVVIIGILAAIAIPVFLNQRNSARDASAESDIRNVATVMETAYTADGQYPDSDTALNDADPKLSAGNALIVTEYSSTGGTIADSFEIYGCNLESQKEFFYSSAQGGFLGSVADLTVTPETTGGACAAATDGITLNPL